MTEEENLAVDGGVVVLLMELLDSLLLIFSYKRNCKRHGES
jgi:hypothetical protein